MAETALARIAMLYSLIAFVALAATSLKVVATKYQNLKETNIVFYLHDYESGRNLTVNSVAGVPRSRWGILDFGTVFVCDDKMTAAYDWKSEQIGRAQGIFINSALDGSDLHMLMSLVFTNKEFSGSTLEIQGANRFYQKYRDLSVVSGTGMFRLARGFATLETVFLDILSSNAIIRWNVTVFHF
ncbi:hypothetical protein FNV43_RR13327 [Rhamnella rubrinervis]|uniref:Dirigent protein n=1 Tax=Rhamnella rubrinervis TaxID=2594499 RepID=A0A8K0H0W6_9ROSA|nr:hypothetical protein FNV43_RR13327 [Rhamnella rubrinervis]